MTDSYRDIFKNCIFCKSIFYQQTNETLQQFNKRQNCSKEGENTCYR